MAENDVEIIHTHPVQAHVDALSHACRGEIKMLQIIAAKFAAQNKFLTRKIAQHLPQQHLAHTPPIKGRGVDEVHAHFQCHTARPECLIDGHTPKLLTQR